MTIKYDENVSGKKETTCLNIKSYLLNKCIDLDLLAKKIGRTPESFRKALNYEYPEDDKRNLTGDELIKICKITMSSPTAMLSFDQQVEAD